MLSISKCLNIRRSDRGSKIIFWIHQTLNPLSSADLPMSLLSVFSNYWHRFTIWCAFINFLATPVYYVSVSVVIHIFINDIAVTSTKLVVVAMAMQIARCYVLGGRESILLTVIGKNLFFGYPNKLIPMWGFPSSFSKSEKEIMRFIFSKSQH